MGAKLTWVLSGLDVSEAMDVLRGRAIFIVVDGVEKMGCSRCYLRACLQICLKEPVADGACEMQVGIIGGWFGWIFDDDGGVWDWAKIGEAC
jgi:hypothetical protein